MAHIYPYLLAVLSLVIREEIAMNYTEVAILSMTSVLVTIPFTVVFGFIGDRLCKWRLELIIVGYILVFSHTFIIFVANSYSILILAAVVGGIGASVFHPIALPLLSQEFGSERNMAHSFNLIFGTFGSIITPIVSIALSEWLGWRNTSLIFGIAGGIMLPILLILLLFGKKHLQYDPFNPEMCETEISKTHSQIKTTKRRNGNKKLAFLTLPLLLVIFAQIIRSGTFRIMNTFTGLIFEDEFGASELGAAAIMSIVLGLGGVAALISGFISSKWGSLKTFIFAKGSTTVASIFLIVFLGVIKIKAITITVPFLVLAVILFVYLSMSFYFGSPSANGLFAEMVPARYLSSTFGIVNSLMIGFSAATPVIFGAIVDQNFSLPYEYLMLIVLSLIPFLLLLYVKSSIKVKEPTKEDIEKSYLVQSTETGAK